ncbi:hypothetical protein MSG28_001361 [Choristoneura fumiferana]|uniref:Uncharacterized protein n=2 Tax=Choristoneura fumiferana TaxID=7141 RepID=A0ACC0KU93_CHOFU|nr:hypothetical protein MSG28_001361 [Choristoneura fumiferana]
MTHSNVLKCKTCNIVIDEMLSYIQNKLSVADDNLLVNVCTSAFSSEEIKKSKSLLFEALSTDQRNVLRKGTGKVKRDIDDILRVLRWADMDTLPVFVARQLEKLPPIDFDHLDCTKLLKDMAKLRSEIEVIKTSYAKGSQVEDLRIEINNLKFSSIPHTPLRNINSKRGAWMHDSGPIGLSPQLSMSPFRNSPENKLDESYSADRKDSPKVNAPKQQQQCGKKVVGAKCKNDNVKYTNSPFVMTHTERSMPDLNEQLNGDPMRDLHDPVLTDDYPQTKNNNDDGWQVQSKRKKNNYRYMGKKGTAFDTTGKFKAAEGKTPILITK